MGNGDEPRKTPNTDNQETSVLGDAPSAASNPPTPVPGTLLNNRYLLIRQLNAGGFGTVHLAHDQQMHGRPVVVKIQINQRVDDPWFERKFSEEVRALSLLDHPGVVVAFDSGRTADGMPFLVMQYVEGSTLRAVMSPEGMPLARAAEILKQLGHALAAAHDKGIWHRDLKPENVMLQSSPGAEDRVRLIDFGIATVADVQSRYQTSTRVAGSVLYMAPEQSMGQPTALTDIYAMGLIAYEMVTGRRPFPAENAMQMMAMQQRPVRVKPSDLRPSVPDSAEQLILSSLDPDPARRPQNARAFGDRLHDSLLGLGPSQSFVAAAPPPPLPPPPPSFVAPSPSTLPPPQPPQRNRRFRPFWLVIVGLAVLSGIYKDWRKPTKATVVKVAKPSPAPVADAEKPAQQALVSEDAIELAFWNSVKDSTEPRLYNEYLAKYPEGRFASLAKAKLDILSKKKDAPKDASKDASKEAPKVASAPNPPIDSELAFWSSLKSEDGPQRYRDYLAKYPNGMFASVAKLILSSMDKAAAVAAQKGAIPPMPEPPEPVDESSPRYRRKVPPPRAPLSLDTYEGPMEGDLRWSGRLLNNSGVIIQGGQANTGVLAGDLPRVPVTVQVTHGDATIILVPSFANKWDHLSLRNLSGVPVKSFAVHWKVKK
jgi:serine/threonine protein kinase